VRTRRCPRAGAVENTSSRSRPSRSRSLVARRAQDVETRQEQRGQAYACSLAPESPVIGCARPGRAQSASTWPVRPVRSGGAERIQRQTRSRTRSVGPGTRPADQPAVGIVERPLGRPDACAGAPRVRADRLPARRSTLLRQPATSASRASAARCPAAGASTPARMRSRVDLPAPYAPTAPRRHPVRRSVASRRTASRSACAAHTAGYEGCGHWVLSAPARRRTDLGEGNVPPVAISGDESDRRCVLAVVLLAGCTPSARRAVRVRLAAPGATNHRAPNAPARTTQPTPTTRRRPRPWSRLPRSSLRRSGPSPASWPCGWRGRGGPGARLPLADLRYLTLTYAASTARCAPASWSRMPMSPRPSRRCSGPLFAADYRSGRCGLEDDFGADDDASIGWDNTSGFKLPDRGRHADLVRACVRRAVDLNPCGETRM